MAQLTGVSSCSEYSQQMERRALIQSLGWICFLHPIMLCQRKVSGLGFFWDYSQTAIYEAAHKQDIFDGVPVENDITSGKLGIEVSVNVHRNPSLAEVIGCGHKLWISMSDISEAVFIKKKKKKASKNLIVWSLRKQVLIQLHLLIALLFWAFPDIFLGFAWTFLLIKTKGCHIAPWFMASKRSEGTESVHPCKRVLCSGELDWKCSLCLLCQLSLPTA